MEKNVGKTDKTIRIVVGVILLVLAYLLRSTGFMWTFIVLGVIALATAAMSFCGLYTLLGVNTCALKTTAKKK